MPRRNLNASRLDSPPRRRGGVPRRTRGYWDMCKRLGFTRQTPRRVLAWR